MRTPENIEFNVKGTKEKSITDVSGAIDYWYILCSLATTYPAAVSGEADEEIDIDHEEDILKPNEDVTPSNEKPTNGSKSPVDPDKDGDLNSCEGDISEEPMDPETGVSVPANTWDSAIRCKYYDINKTLLYFIMWGCLAWHLLLKNAVAFVEWTHSGKLKQITLKLLVAKDRRGVHLNLQPEHVQFPSKSDLGGGPWGGQGQLWNDACRD